MPLFFFAGAYGGACEPRQGLRKIRWIYCANTWLKRCSNQSFKLRASLRQKMTFFWGSRRDFFLALEASDIRPISVLMDHHEKNRLTHSVQKCRQIQGNYTKMQCNLYTLQATAAVHQRQRQRKRQKGKGPAPSHSNQNNAKRRL